MRIALLFLILGVLFLSTVPLMTAAQGEGVK